MKNLRKTVTDDELHGNIREYAPQTSRVTSKKTQFKQGKTLKNVWKAAVGAAVTVAAAVVVVAALHVVCTPQAIGVDSAKFSVRVNDDFDGELPVIEYVLSQTSTGDAVGFGTLKGSEATLEFDGLKSLRTYTLSFYSTDTEQQRTLIYSTRFTTEQPNGGLVLGGQQSAPQGGGELPPVVDPVIEPERQDEPEPPPVDAAFLSISEPYTNYSSYVRAVAQYMLNDAENPVLRVYLDGALKQTIATNDVLAAVGSDGICALTCSVGFPSPGKHTIKAVLSYTFEGEAKVIEQSFSVGYVGAVASSLSVTQLTPGGPGVGISGKVKVYSAGSGYEGIFELENVSILIYQNGTYVDSLNLLDMSPELVTYSSDGSISFNLEYDFPGISTYSVVLRVKYGIGPPDGSAYYSRSSTRTVGNIVVITG